MVLQWPFQVIPHSFSNYSAYDEVKYIGSLLVCINAYIVDPENLELFPLLLSFIFIFIFF